MCGQRETQMWTGAGVPSLVQKLRPSAHPPAVSQPPHRRKRIHMRGSRPTRRHVDRHLSLCGPRLEEARRIAGSGGPKRHEARISSTLTMRLSLMSDAAEQGNLVASTAQSRPLAPRVAPAGALGFDSLEVKYPWPVWSATRAWRCDGGKEAPARVFLVGGLVSLVSRPCSLAAEFDETYKT